MHKYFIVSYFYHDITLLRSKKAIKSTTVIFGDISTSIWIHIGHPSVIIMFTPFHSHNAFTIIPISEYSLYKNLSSVL